MEVPPEITPRSAHFAIPADLPPRNRRRSRDVDNPNVTPPTRSRTGTGHTPFKSVSFPSFRPARQLQNNGTELRAGLGPFVGSAGAERGSVQGDANPLELSLPHGESEDNILISRLSSMSESDEEDTKDLENVEEGHAQGFSHQTDVGGNFTTPRSRKRTKSSDVKDVFTSPRPPSFARSEFETIVRRLRNRDTLLKKSVGGAPRSRLFPNNMKHDWQFAGWGSLRYLDLKPGALDQATARLAAKLSTRKLGQYQATSIAANAVLGSVFYASPAICAVADIYSPICMTVACCVLFLFRPILLELGSAMRLDGANYRYLLNVSTKGMALLGAAITIIDAIATGIVSAATASSYVDGEIALPFPEWVLACIILLVLTATLMMGVRESSGVTLAICGFHCVTMLALFLASVVHWGRQGNEIISANWDSRPQGGTAVARSIFNGICIGLLGVTGFESTPAFIAQIKESAYKSVLRNLIYGALAVNIPILLVIYACLSSEAIFAGANILSALGNVAAGPWLSKVVVVDSVLVLCGGVLTGAVSTCSVVEGLVADRALPELFGKALPRSGALWMACLLYLALCVMIYAASGFSLSQSSNLFSMAFMAVLFMFAISALVLKFNRDRLKRATRTSIATLMSAIIVMIVVMAGNIAQAPIIVLLFAVTLMVMLIVLGSLQRLPTIYEWLLYLVEHIPTLRKYRLTENFDETLIAGIKGIRHNPVCVWVKDDEISTMVELVLYVKANEQTARIVLVHAYSLIEDIPSELEANTKLCDEAFPDITIDLALVSGDFSPAMIEAVSQQLNIPKNLMFIGTPTSTHPHTLAEYDGARTIRG